MEGRQWMGHSKDFLFVGSVVRTLIDRRIAETGKQAVKNRQTDRGRNKDAQRESQKGSVR